MPMSAKYRPYLWIALALAAGGTAGAIAWMACDYQRIVYGITMTTIGIFALMGITYEMADSDDDGPTWGAR